MELQVRIAYETAEMLAFLKEHYQNSTGINFSKGEVLSKAITDTYDDWKEIEWNKTLGLPIEIDKNYEISSSSQRPKFQISNKIDNKIDELRTIIKQSVDSRSVTIGAAIKFVLHQAIHELQHSNDITVENVINDVLNEMLNKETSSDKKEILKKYTDNILTKLELNDLL